MIRKFLTATAVVLCLAHPGESLASANTDTDEPSWLAPVPSAWYNESYDFGWAGPFTGVTLAAGAIGTATDVLDGFAWRDRGTGGGTPTAIAHLPHSLIAAGATWDAASNDGLPPSLGGAESSGQIAPSELRFISPGASSSPTVTAGSNPGGAATNATARLHLVRAPELASMVVLGTGLIALGRFRLRRRKPA